MLVTQSAPTIAQSLPPVRQLGRISGRTIAGFGRNHTVYLAYTDPGGGVRIERAQAH
jgi:hypothetical protein